MNPINNTNYRLLDFGQNYTEQNSQTDIPLSFSVPDPNFFNTQSSQNFMYGNFLNAESSQNLMCGNFFILFYVLYF